MKKDEFHNALRILASIDAHELIEAGIENEWRFFVLSPCSWFIHANDADADKLWAIIVRRSKR